MTMGYGNCKKSQHRRSGCATWRGHHDSKQDVIKRRAGVEADLNVYEGQSHAQYGFDPNTPETKDALTDIAKFFRPSSGKLTAGPRLGAGSSCRTPSDRAWRHKAV
jgi:hypothetical protein